MSLSRSQGGTRLRRQLLTGALLIGSSGWLGFSQSSATAPRIDVASIKPHLGDLPKSGGSLAISGQRIAIHGFSVLGLLWFAYNIRNDQISASHPFDHVMYDVDVLAEGHDSLTRDEFRTLVRQLLAERFALRAHKESREKPIYALAAGKGAPALKESSPDALAEWRGIVAGHNIGFEGRRQTMAALAELLSSSGDLDRPVVDATGLVGEYDFKLVYSSPSRMSIVGAIDQIDIFKAVEEQLGLKLERRVVSRELLIVDHIEKPSGN